MKNLLKSFTHYTLVVVCIGIVSAMALLSSAEKTYATEKICGGGWVDFIDNSEVNPNDPPVKELLKIPFEISSEGKKLIVQPSEISNSLSKYGRAELGFCITSDTDFFYDTLKITFKGDIEGDRTFDLNKKDGSPNSSGCFLYEGNATEIIDGKEVDKFFHDFRNCIFYINPITQEEKSKIKAIEQIKTANEEALKASTSATPVGAEKYVPAVFNKEAYVAYVNKFYCGTDNYCDKKLSDDALIKIFYGDNFKNNYGSWAVNIVDNLEDAKIYAIRSIKVMIDNRKMQRDFLLKMLDEGYYFPIFIKPQNNLDAVNLDLEMKFIAENYLGEPIKDNLNFSAKVLGNNECTKGYVADIKQNGEILIIKLRQSGEVGFQCEFGSPFIYQIGGNFSQVINTKLRCADFCYFQNDTNIFAGDIKKSLPELFKKEKALKIQNTSQTQEVITETKEDDETEKDDSSISSPIDYSKEPVELTQEQADSYFEYISSNNREAGDLERINHLKKLYSQNLFFPFWANSEFKDFQSEPPSQEHTISGAKEFYKNSDIDPEGASWVWLNTNALCDKTISWNFYRKGEKVAFTETHHSIIPAPENCRGILQISKKGFRSLFAQGFSGNPPQEVFYPPDRALKFIIVDKPSSPVSASQKTHGTATSKISDSMPKPSELSTDPKVIATNGLYSLVFLILFYIASTLFNRTLEFNKDRFHKRIIQLPLIGKWFGMDEAEKIKYYRHHSIHKLLMIIGAFVAYGLLTSFIEFGSTFTIENFILFSLMVLASAVYGLSTEIVKIIHFEKWGISNIISPYPFGLVFVGISVALTVILDIQPAILFGTPLLLISLKKMLAHKEAEVFKLELYTVAVMLLTALGLYFSTDYIEETSPFYAFLMITFLMIIQGLAFEMIPTNPLMGGTIWQKNKWIWFAIVFPVVFIFFHTMLNPYSDLASSTITNKAFLALGGYSVFAFFFWLKYGNQKTTPATK